MIITYSGLVFTEALFTAETSKEIDYESLGIKADLEPVPFVFKISQISNFNEGSDKKTTLRLKNGDSFAINEDFLSFCGEIKKAFDEKRRLKYGKK